MIPRNKSEIPLLRIGMMDSIGLTVCLGGGFATAQTATLIDSRHSEKPIGFEEFIWKILRQKSKLREKNS